MSPTTSNFRSRAPLHKPLSSHRQQKSFGADTKAGTLLICTTAHHLLLGSKFRTAHFETATVQIIAEASAGRIVDFIPEAKRIEKPGRYLLATFDRRFWIGAEILKSQLGEFAVAAGLRSLIAITSSDIKQHPLPLAAQQFAASLLKECCRLRNQAASPSLLIRKCPHLADNLAAAGLLNEGVLRP